MIIDDLTKLINGNKDIILFQYQRYFLIKKVAKMKNKYQIKIC